MNTARRIKQWITVFILIGSSFSCTESAPLEIALQKAGKNRQEMEKVLAYFSHSPRDSLKYNSARFLIENMLGHATYSNKEMRQYLVQMDWKLKETKWDERLLTKLLLFRFSDSFLEELQTTEDIEKLTSSFLIAHIESTFRQKDSCVWLQDVDFSDFCEYLLPYRIDKEEPILWRDSTLKGFQSMYDYIQIYDDTRTSTVNLSKVLSNVLRAHWQDVVKKLPSPMNQHKPDCLDDAISGLIIHRLCGIPAAIDMIPCWGNYNGQHTWVQPIGHEIRYMNQIEKFNKNIPKVYRKTYSMQFDPSSEKPNDYIPAIFQDPHLKDVTNEYVNGVEVKEIGFPKNVRFGYLCVFNQKKWIPVSRAVNQSGKCIFPYMGPGIIYLPAYFQDEQPVPTSTPFILKSNGKKMYLQNSDKKEKIALRRKYPMESRKGYYIKRITGSIIEASNSKHFRISDTICTILNNPPMQPIELKLNQRYHFFRIVPTLKTSAHIAEIYFFNNVGKRIYGDMEGSTSNSELLNDGDILTSTWISGSLSFSFNLADTVTSICLLPYNDGNGVYPENEYELFYFDKERQWVSCGKKIADDYQLDFEKVPQGALLWLRNLTCGNEERIFTYENGKQRFW